MHPTLTCKEAIDILNKEGFDQLPIVSEDNEILGVVTEGNLSAKLISGRIKGTDKVVKGLYPQYSRVSLNSTCGELARIFDRDAFALIVTSQKVFGTDGTMTEKKLVYGVVSRIDLLKFIMAGPKK